MNKEKITEEEIGYLINSYYKDLSRASFWMKDDHFEILEKYNNRKIKQLEKQLKEIKK